MIDSRIYNFDCETKEEATAALLVYAVYNSRNRDKFKVSTEMWGQIERFVKSSAKRSENLQRFVESLRPKLYCENLNPKHLSGGNFENKPLKINDEYVEFNSDDQRTFLSSYLDKVNHSDVIDLLYNETTYIVMLVRERIENEKKLGKLGA